MSGDMFWLGRKPIQEQAARVVLPTPVVDLDVADIRDPLFWADDIEEDVIVISRLRHAFVEGDRFTHLGESQVAEHRVTHIPREVMDEYDGFDYGGQLHFVMTAEDAAEDRCMVLPEDAAQELFDEFGGMGGGEK